MAVGYAPICQGLPHPARREAARLAAAGLRTSAAYARWEEIKLGDVDPVIQFTRELMSAHLG
jgi:hypothetical protein